jgi:hypothetical protein
VYIGQSTLHVTHTRADSLSLSLSLSISLSLSLSISLSLSLSLYQKPSRKTSSRRGRVHDAFLFFASFFFPFAHIAFVRDTCHNTQLLDPPQSRSIVPVVCFILFGDMWCKTRPKSPTLLSLTPLLLLCPRQTPCAQHPLLLRCSTRPAPRTLTEGNTSRRRVALRGTPQNVGRQGLRQVSGSIYWQAP